jgi:hypothetical protein
MISSRLGIIAAWRLGTSSPEVFYPPESASAGSRFKLPHALWARLLGVHSLFRIIEPPRRTSSAEAVSTYTAQAPGDVRVGSMLLKKTLSRWSARLLVERPAPSMISHGEDTRMAKADYRTKVGECCRMAALAPRPADGAKWLKLASE